MKKNQTPKSKNVGADASVRPINKGITCRVGASSVYNCCNKIKDFDNNLCSAQYNEGITLVALVVTIIVLIILAGVTLNIVLDENGIIRKAMEAAEKTKEEQLKE